MKEMGRFYPFNCTATKNLLDQWHCVRAYLGHSSAIHLRKTKNGPAKLCCTAPLGLTSMFNLL